MKTLFFRLLVSLWLTMTILVGIFAVIHAWSFSKDASLRWRRMSSRTNELRALQALDCRRTSGEQGGCDELLEPLDERDPKIAVFKDGVRIMGGEFEGDAEMESITRASRTTSVKSAGNRELAALYLDRATDGPYVVVSTQTRPSRWNFFLVPETLPLRLGAIMVVTGLVSFALARHLSRPIRILRRAARRLGGGDLSVRVVPDLAGADTESLALGREMDRMAERIEALVETQRRLLRDVSHELRSPLARLMIALELVRRKSPPDATDALDRIEREAQRLEEMIAELLTLSRLEAGVGMETPGPVDVLELARSIVDDVSFEAEQHGAKVVLTHSDAAEVAGNADLLRRALENVVRNAARYTEAGSSVEVGVVNKGEAVELIVRDHGPGVPADALSKIFQPFYRVADDRARKSGGAGIGLAIAERAIALHGGNVVAENGKGGGLVVTMQVPLERVVVEPGPQSEALSTNVIP